uniref:Uncharacterized protein n=1 Tax=Brassica oleracea TaxID=3712 RepID=A0A3P6BVQ2_BRAOL|nr:unnamed protein product [Brassica oleracea]
MGVRCSDSGYGHCGCVFLPGESLLQASKTWWESTHEDLSGYCCCFQEGEC